MENIDTYKVRWDNEEDGLLYGISVVDTPANMYETVQLSKQEKLQMQVELTKKKQLAGVVLIPNQKILRYSKDKGEYNVIFEADTIEKLAHNLFIGDYHKNSWYNHEKDSKLEGSTIVESWIISDETKDKAFALGFKDLPVGTWMATMQLSDKAWEDYVETGKVKGFSIDSMMSLEKVEMRESNNNNNNQIKIKMGNYVKQFIKMLKEEEAKESMDMITVEREDGNLEVEALTEGSKVMIGEEAFSNGEFTFEGMIYKTNEEGMISEMSEVVEDSEESDEELPELDLSDEEAKKDLFEMIEKDEELVKVLKEKYGTDEKEAVNMSVESAKNNEEVKSQLRKVFLEEIESLNLSISSKEEEIKTLKEKLEETPSTGKLKANVNLSKSDNKPLKGIEAIRNTMNKNKK